MKSRGVYETPGGAILYFAHGELEHLCLDRQTYSFKQLVGQKMAEVIYGGLWFTPLREALSAFVDATQRTVTGKVRLKLYKGSDQFRRRYVPLFFVQHEYRELYHRGIVQPRGC